MSAQWVTIPVTLFTAVLSAVAGNQSYVVISNEMHHDSLQ